MSLGLAAGVARADFVAYVSDLTSDSIVRLHDLNNDGDYNDAGESARFFGPSNASGWPGVGSAQTILVLGYDDVLAADGEESGGFATRVYRLRDLNGDGDAMDAGEATEYWDSILPIGVNFDRPKDMMIGPDGAIYLADNNTINFDNDTPEAIWRLEDLNSDGDVNDAGEVTLHYELSPAGTAFGFVCEDFKYDSVGRLWFSNQTSSSNDTNIWILEPDLSLTPWCSDADLLGISFHKTGMTLNPMTERPMVQAVDIFENLRIIEFVDSNNNGMIDDNGELRSWYRSDVAVSVVSWDPNNALDLEFAPDGSLWMLDLAANTILRFVDTNSDDDYLDAGEAMVIYNGAAASYVMDFPRTVGFASLPCPADLVGSGGGPPDGMIDVNDLFHLLANWNTNGPGANLAPPDNIVNVADLFALLAAWGPCN